MLHNARSDCFTKMKFAMVIFFIFITFSFLFPFILIGIVFFFLYSDYDLENLLQNFGVYDCIKKMYPDNNDIYVKRLSKITKNVDDYSRKLRNKQTKHKHKKSSNIIKKSKINRKQDPKINYNKTENKKQVINTNKNKTTNISIKTSIQKSFSKTNNKKSKKTNFEFNQGKSIWDDYESVFDKMDKQ